MNDRVMVVTPVYCTEENGRLPLLLQSLFWVREQTHPNLVHVVVDDGSTDETPELLERIAGHNPHLRVYHKDNGGSSSAVNFGVEAALRETDAQFITISHSDDVLPPTSIEDRVEAMLRNQSEMVYSDMLIFDDRTGEARLKIAPEHTDSEDLYLALRECRIITFPTMLWRRPFFTDRLGGYDERITSAEDWDIALRSAQEMYVHGDSHESIHEITAAHRVHENNLGRENLRDGTKWNCCKMILRKHLSGNDYRVAIARQGIRLLRGMLVNLPEPVKKPLRQVRDFLMTNPNAIIPYSSEFVAALDTIQYRNLLMQGASR